MEIFLELMSEDTDFSKIQQELRFVNKNWRESLCILVRPSWISHNLMFGKEFRNIKIELFLLEIINDYS